MSQNHERLLGQSQQLIEDFTCPISGIPTPDREPFRSTRPISPLTKCVRSMWGVSENGNAIKITQGYGVGSFDQISDPAFIHRREMRVDLYESGVHSPVSVLHYFTSRTDGPQYRGFAVEALEPSERWPGTLKSTDEVQGISQRTLSTLNEHSLAWFVPIDSQSGLSTPNSLQLTTVSDGIDTGSIHLASVDGDARILLAPYLFPEDTTASLFVREYIHRPTAPGPDASREHVEFMTVTISEQAAALHGLMSQVGAVDISKI